MIWKHYFQALNIAGTKLYKNLLQVRFFARSIYTFALFIQHLSDQIFISDAQNNDIESITMAKKKKTKKKSSKKASWMPKFRAESLNEFYAFALIIIVFVTFYQFYSFSTEAYDMFV